MGAIVPGGSGNHGYQLFTSSGTFTVPAGVTRLNVRAIGGGGGGGGGGTTSASTTTQYGGGGGGPGGVTEAAIPVTAGEALTVTIGAGGAGGAGGAAGGNAGSSGNNGGVSSLTGGSVGVYGPFGNGAQGSGANGGGAWGGGPSQGYGAVGPGQSANIGSQAWFIPGWGGNSNNNQYPTSPLNGLAPGEVGQPSSATNGGLGGWACQLANGWGYTQQNYSGTGGSATANGGAGLTPTVPGCGGGGGGAGAVGGTGGAGGNGSAGQIEIWW